MTSSSFWPALPAGHDGEPRRGIVNFPEMLVCLAAPRRRFGDGQGGRDKSVDAADDLAKRVVAGRAATSSRTYDSSVRWAGLAASLTAGRPARWAPVAV